MKLRMTLAPAILLPVTATIFLVVAFAMVLSSLSNMSQVEDTLRDQQDQMIQVGNVRLGGFEVAENAVGVALCFVVVAPCVVQEVEIGSFDEDGKAGADVDRIEFERRASGGRSRRRRCRW